MSSLRRSPRVSLLAIVVLLAFPGSSLAAEDVDPPTGTITINDGAPYVNQAEVTLNVPADDASGVVTVSLSNDGITWDERPYQSTLQWFLPFVSGEPLAEVKRTVRARWTDAAGNTSASAKASIVVDTTPPEFTVEIWSVDATTVTFALTAEDAHGIDRVLFSCDGMATWIEREFATRVTVGLRADGLGCVGYDDAQLISVVVVDGAGNSPYRGVYADLQPELGLETPYAAVTGQSFTITPVLPSDYVLPESGGCRWEFRWGDDASLDRHEFNETFGAMVFDIPSSDGGCTPWTFTLPWVPYRQFDATVSPFTRGHDGEARFFTQTNLRFMAVEGSTERRILNSSLPVAQVLPSTFSPIVGVPITYTRYLVGGATAGGNSMWLAQLGSGEHPRQWEQSGGSTFTFTPTTTGALLVTWDRRSDANSLGASYDPPVRYRDTKAPTTTAPKQRSGPGSARGKVPVELRWTGADKGWGLASYRLQQSKDGGAWASVLLTDPASTSSIRWLIDGHDYRFRVRAVDKAGNLGAWTPGSTFTVASRPRWPVAIGR